METFIYRATLHQWRVLNTTRKLIFLGGGVGTGKTDAGVAWALWKAAKTPPGVIGLICANSYGQLIDSTLRKFYRLCETAHIRLDPPRLPTAHRSINLRVDFGSHEAEILCRSLESVDFLAGLEVGWWWVDEAFQTTQQAIHVLQARLRDQRSPSLQALLTTTLDEPGSWMHRMFVEQVDPELMEVIYATTFDNAHNLPPGYAEGLRATYSSRLYERMVLARWVSLDAGMIYHAFDPARHVDASVALDPHARTFWSHDFNIGAAKPMSSLLCQLRKGAGPNGHIRSELVVIDEIVMETADTCTVIAEFKARFPGVAPGEVWICGDATGYSRDTRSGETDYTILAREGFANRLVPRQNPAVRNRHNAVNSWLMSAAGDHRIRIHPSCRTLIRGLSTVHLRKGSGYQEEETREQHITTALGYLVCQVMHLDSNTDQPRFWK